MALTNTQDHYHTVLITAVKGSIVQAPGVFLVIITMLTIYQCHFDNGNMSLNVIKNTLECSSLASIFILT